MRDKVVIILLSITVLIIIGIAFLILKQPQSGQTSTTNDLSEITKVTDKDWVYNQGDDKITLLEYSDFQCPACGYYYTMIAKLKEDYKDNLRIVYRHYPLPNHKNARIAARASEAAGRQDKFWEMHDRLFETQNDWAELPDPKEKFKQLAMDIELDVDTFMKDLDDTNLDTNVQAGVVSGNQLGVRGTPTFYLNGEKIPNPKSYEDFKSIIDAY